MFYIKDQNATVWSIEDKNTYVSGRISTSEKDTRNEGSYINSNWFATFVGNCKSNALKLSSRDRIKILSGKVTNITKGEGDNKKSYTNVTIFDFENLTNPNNNNNNFNEFTVPEDEDLPF